MIKNEASIKAFILRYFSQDLQYDETIAGAMERKQLQKWLTDWAKDYPVSQSVEKPEVPGIKKHEWDYLETKARRKAFRAQK